jgi:phosphate transport system permease protein
MHWSRKYKDKGARIFMLGIAIIVLSFLIMIGSGVFFKALPVIKEKNFLSLITSGVWKPFKGNFGFLPFIVSTIYVSIIAILLSFPFSLLTSIYLNSYASKTVIRIFEPVIDLLSGIPPVIYGVWGTLAIVPFISNRIAPLFVDFSTGYTVIAGGIVLAVMITPLLVSVMVEIFRSIPQEMIDASLSLGATKWQTVKKVIVRRSFSGIVAANVLALSRAFGETMAVLMVCGNIPLMPHSLFDACYPLPALIANNYGEMLSMPDYESALMLAAFLLFIIVILFNGLSRLVLNQIERRYQFA